jgi:hypothetical protein
MNQIKKPTQELKKETNKKTLPLFHLAFHLLSTKELKQGVCHTVALPFILKSI